MAKLCAELLAEWMAEHPGNRPYVWWAFDAPERRKGTDGEPLPFDNAERNAKVEHWRRKYPTCPNGRRLSSTSVCRRA